MSNEYKYMTVACIQGKSNGKAGSFPIPNKPCNIIKQTCKILLAKQNVHATFNTGGTTNHII